MNRYFLYIIIALQFYVILSCYSAFAQNDSISPPVSPITINGYAEMYYNFNASHVKDNRLLFYMVNHSRANELAVNLAYIRGAYENKNFRASVALMAGTYTNDNLALEPGTLKNIFEANVGFRLKQSKDLWLYAGVFSSHLGFESAVGKDCPTLTRSIMAEGTPYYESGLKLDYGSSNKKWRLTGFILNGWQHIQKPQGNYVPALGTQITFTPNEKILLNSSSFVGSDKPDSLHAWRYFHDFYAAFSLSKKLTLYTAFDIGAEKMPGDVAGYSQWYSCSVIAKWWHSKKLYSSLRAEYFHDPDGVIFHYPNKGGFKMTGYSYGLNMLIQPNILLRMEAKYLDGIGNRLNLLQNTTANLIMTGAVCIGF